MWHISKAFHWLQDMSLANEENMPMVIRCGIMALVAAYLNFLSQMIANPAFCQHVSKVNYLGIKERVQEKLMS